MNMHPRVSLLPACLLFTASTFALAGCDAIGALKSFEEDSNDLVVYTTHYATPENGIFPDRGADSEARVFENDLGWRVVLTNAYVVTAAVELVSCKGNQVPVDMYWGPCPEDMTTTDLDSAAIGGMVTPAALYCEIIIDYGNYDPDASGSSEFKHPIPDDPEVVGATIYLAGYAELGDQSVPFDLRYTDSVSTTLDISTIDDGAPFRVEKGTMQAELTLSKTYDAFFQGVDFTNLDEAALTARLGDILVDQTRASVGKLADMYDPM